MEKGRKTPNQKGFTMKKIYAILLVTMLCCVSCIVYAEKNDGELTEFYPRLVMVVDFDYIKDLVICVDVNGDEWLFYGTDDYLVGDVCILMMWNNSDDYTDHEIVAVFYEGHLDNGIFMVDPDFSTLVR